MYILKNAIRSINRSKGRNILIGIIIFVIAVSSCIALSIREAADEAREKSLSDLEITGQITMNRQNMMNGQEDRESMKEALTSMEGLSLEELETYAKLSTVKDFYYTVSASLNGNEALEAVDTTGASGETTETAEGNVDNTGGTEIPGELAQEGQNTGGMKGMPGRMGTQGDFTVTGYSCDAAMTDFVQGNKSIVAGSMFTQNDTENRCIISQELATYNSLNVGDTMVLQNPNQEDETYTFTINGIYQSNETEDSSGSMMGGFSVAFDSANQIYTSYENLQAVSERSTENAEVTTDQETGRESTTALQSQTTGTYAFADMSAYEDFKEQAEEALGENYTVTSTDLTQYEQSLLPLENLSKYAGYFLVIILGIGGIILIVLNIFNIRERKYEIGVLAAIGMKKGKIAVQLIVELLCVTFAVIVIGAAVGAAASIPVTNKLLAQQIESATSQTEEQTANFGRAPGSEGNQADRGQMPGNPNNAASGMASTYINQISSATNITVLIELIGIGLMLTIISGCVAVVFILRYDPLRILSNRD